ncbi:hypothetical protein HY605_05290 [Candidatus Peregrinibacteria bacterium]|nr:hypothetical protein [Candidatus Peregrinibacteria bacterium]
MLEVDGRFAEAIGLFLGDGDMHRKEKRHLSFASKEHDIAIFIMWFLRERLFVSYKDITVLMQYNSYMPNISEVSEKLGISKLLTRFSPRHRHPTFQIQVNGVVFRLAFEAIVAKFLSSDFMRKPPLRRGFLRGLFAAEGCVAPMNKEQYLGNVSFTLSIFEKSLAETLGKALYIEEISFRENIRMDNNSREIIITNWQNYLKCWKIGLFDRCTRKKQVFLSVAKKCKVYGVVDKKDLKKIALQYRQNELASLIGSWQGNVSRMLKGKILFSLDQVKKLESLGFSLSLKELRVGCLTPIPYSEETLQLFLTGGS